MKRSLAFALVCAVISAACGGSSNPTSPSSPSATGATVNGSVISTGGSMSTASVGRTHAISIVAGLSVSVVGTDISSPVDHNGQFTLRAVPSGSRRFKFSSSVVNATVDLANVQPTETISLAVSVTPTTALIESVSRSTGTAEQLEGRIESIPPSPAGSLIVGGRSVITDAATKILQGNTTLTFASLIVGQRVHVKGAPSGESLLASVIDLQNTNVDILVPINGTIANFTGTTSAFQFEINGRLIKGDAQTEFFGNSDFTDIANGERAEVKGVLKEAFVYAARMKVNVDDDDDDDDGEDESASIEGTLTSKSGAAPTLTLVVDGTTVTTTGSTVVQRRGDVQDLSTIEVGMTLHVIGARQADSSIIARRIQIKDDLVGSLFEIEGSMGGVSGTCAALSFKINGFSIVTNGTTTFTPVCSAAAYKSGTKVKVKGVVQAGGSILATSVEK